MAKVNVATRTKIQSILASLAKPCKYYYIPGEKRHRYFWDTRPTLCGEDYRKRFASGILLFIKARNQWEPKALRWHATRKGAQARALALRDKAKRAK